MKLSNSPTLDDRVVGQQSFSVAALALALALVFLRPTFLGEAFAPGSLLILFAIRGGRILSWSRYVFLLIIFFVIYIANLVLSSSYQGLKYNFTPQLAAGFFTIFSVMSISRIDRLLLKKALDLFSMLVMLIAFGYLVQTYLFTSPCFNFSLVNFGGRPYTYSACGTFTIFVGGRLTGFAAEPGVWALIVYASCYWMQRSFSYAQSGLGWAKRAFIYALAGSSLFGTQTGLGRIIFIFLLFEVVILLTSDNNLLRYCILLLLLPTSFTIISKVVHGVIDWRGRANSLTLSDRNLQSNLVDNLIHIFQNPLGDLSRSGQFTYSLGINLFTETLVFGWLPFFLVVILFARTRATNSIKDFWLLKLVVLMTITFAQPGITNPFWIIFLYCVSVANIGVTSNPKVLQWGINPKT